MYTPRTKNRQWSHPCNVNIWITGHPHIRSDLSFPHIFMQESSDLSQYIDLSRVTSFVCMVRSVFSSSSSSPSSSFSFLFISSIHYSHVCFTDSSHSHPLSPPPESNVYFGLSILVFALFRTALAACFPIPSYVVPNSFNFYCLYAFSDRLEPKVLLSLSLLFFDIILVDSHLLSWWIGDGKLGKLPPFDTNRLTNW